MRIVALAGLMVLMTSLANAQPRAQRNLLDERSVIQNHPAVPLRAWPYANAAAYPAGRFIIEPDNSGRLNFDSVLARGLQRAIDSVLYVFNAKGISAAVSIPGQGLWQGTSGLSTAQDSIRPEMRFSIASNTKTFMSTIVLKLVEEGRISLDDTVGRLLPPFPNIPGGVTIRQLLNMTSGIFDYVNDSGAAFDSISASPNRYWSPEEIIRTFVGPPIQPPGRSWRYSNTNTILAGMIIRDSTNSMVSAQLRQRILDPLSLRSTFFPREDTLFGPIAHPWYQGVDLLSFYGPALFSMVWTAGAMFSTSGDLARWAQALYGGQILSPASLAQMLTFVPRQAVLGGGFREDGYGLSVSRLLYFGRQMWGHGGHLDGYRSEVTYYPSTGVSVVVLINQSPSAPVYESLSALMHEYLRTFSVTPANPGIVYAASGSGDVYSLDTATTAIAPIGLGRYGGIVTFRINPRSRQLLGLATSSGRYELVKIDGSSGEAFPHQFITFASPPTEVKGMTFSSDGTLYLGSTDGRLFTVDTNTGFATQIASPGIPIAGLDFNPLTRQLWASVRAGLFLRDRIYKINLSSGDTILVGRTGFNQQALDIQFDRRGNLYGIIAGSPQNRLARIDTTTGIGTEIGLLGTYSLSTFAFWPDTSTVSTLIAAESPQEFVLSQNYPNPFNPSTTIEFVLPKSSRVKLRVFDLLGREVATLLDEQLPSGNYKREWNARDASTGVYFYKLQASGFAATKKLMLLR